MVPGKILAAAALAVGSLAVGAPAGAVPAVGSHVPSLALPTVTGKKFNLRTAGHPVLLNFFTTY